MVRDVAQNEGLSSVLNTTQKNIPHKYMKFINQTIIRLVANLDLIFGRQDFFLPILPKGWFYKSKSM